MQTLIINNGEHAPQKLLELLKGQATVIDRAAFTKEQAEPFDVVFLSGSHWFPIMGNENLLEVEMNFVRTTDKIVVGICYGFEVIVRSFGGTLTHMPEKALGYNEVAVMSPKPFLSRPSFMVCEAHQWKVDTLPGELEILAASEKGIEIVKHRTKPIIGFQFHPEKCVDESFGDEVLFAALKWLEGEKANA